MPIARPLAASCVDAEPNALATDLRRFGWFDGVTVVEQRAPRSIFVEFVDVFVRGVRWIRFVALSVRLAVIVCVVHGWYYPIPPSSILRPGSFGGRTQALMAPRTYPPPSLQRL